MVAGAASSAKETLGTAEANIIAAAAASAALDTLFICMIEPSIVIERSGIAAPYIDPANPGIITQLSKLMRHSAVCKRPALCNCCSLAARCHTDVAQARRRSRTRERHMVSGARATPLGAKHTKNFASLRHAMTQEFPVVITDRTEDVRRPYCGLNETFTNH
jgi:hypothetical protein